jgi:hypothetical protein
MLFFTKIFNTPKLKPTYIWIFLIAFLILNVTTVVLVKSSNKTPSAKPLTVEECKAIYEEYDSTVLDISSDGLKGSIGIKIDPQDCGAIVTYNILFNTNLSKNFQLNEYTEPEYEYAGVLRDPKKERINSDYGVIFPVFENKDKLLNPYSSDLSEINYGHGSNNESTTTFYDGWESSYIFREDSFEKIISKTVYEILDGSNSMDIKQMDENAYSYSLDAELSAKEGSVVKTFDLTITKRVED